MKLGFCFGYWEWKVCFGLGFRSSDRNQALWFVEFRRILDWDWNELGIWRVTECPRRWPWAPILDFIEIVDLTLVLLGLSFRVGRLLRNNNNGSMEEDCTYWMVVKTVIQDFWGNAICVYFWFLCCWCCLRICGSLLFFAEFDLFSL